MLTAEELIDAIRAALPPEGLFADKEWLISPEPFRIDARLASELDKLGYRLQLFNRACNQLYRLSVAGKQPPWIAEYLDRGKPRELVELSRRKEFRDDLPRVIRPDLILTDSGPDGQSGPDGHFGYIIAELDNIPGGIGLTGCLGETYASFGHEILGGAHGMIDGFRRVAGDADILISKEAATYRPEMEWLARQTGLRVLAAETYDPQPSGARQTAEGSPQGGGGRPSQSAVRNPQLLYRFFEHFDLPNIPNAPAIMRAVASGTAHITPPFKPYLEEKLWFALFWLRPLREYWRRELSERQFLKLQQVIPYTWILDPAPLPQHAVIPELNVRDWREVMDFSQKQRELILKISGFSEIGWGSRSVTLGSDASHSEWQAALERALADFSHHPWILQRFHKGGLVEQPYFDVATNTIATLRGRVRLCPYYFVSDNRTHLGGALATIAPADKKLLHGMKDAIMVPTAVS
jgi:hypothetical protein